MSNVRRTSLQAVTTAAALLTLAALTGCAVSDVQYTPAQSQPSANAALTGQIMGAQSPVSGAHIQLWITGGTAYGTANTTPIATSTSAVSTGMFSFPAGSIGPNCPAGSYLYATATGGDPTGTTSTNLNTNILLMAAVGPCSKVSSSTSLNMNELTTVAAAYSLRAFTSESNGVISIGTTAKNTQGLADAFANDALLVNQSTGAVNPSTATVIQPTAALNTVADILAYCVNTSQTTSGTATTQCANLFTAATPPAGAPSAIVPADTFQAALNIAQYPANNVNTLIGYAGSFANYSPTLAATSPAVINDLSIGIGYGNAILDNTSTGPQTLAIDSNDNVFIVGAYSGSKSARTSYIGEIPSASASSAETATLVAGGAGTAGADATPQLGIFDQNNNLFITDSSDGYVFEFAGENLTATPTAFALAVPDSPKTNPLDGASDGTSILAQNTWGIAIDNSNNVFTDAYRSQTNGVTACVVGGSTVNTNCLVEELTNGAFTATYGGATTYASTSRGMAVDANPASATTGTLWIANYGANTVQVVNPGLSTSPSTPTTNTITLTPSGTATYSDPYGVAVDASGNAWVSTYGFEPTTYTVGNSLYMLPAADSTGSTTVNASVLATPSTILSTAMAPGNTATNATAVGGLYHPRYLAIDGDGNIFIANSQNGSLGGVTEYNPNFTVSGQGAPGAYLSPNFGFSPSLSQTTESITSVSITKGTTTGGVTSCTATLYTPQNLSNGQKVTLSGFTNTADSTYLNGQTVTVLSAANPYVFTATVSGTSTTVCPTAALARVSNETGVGTPNTINPAVFSCTAGVCGISNGFSSALSVAVDRAGTVWSLDNNNGFVTAILGLGAPTNPVQAAGAYGVRP